MNRKRTKKLVFGALMAALTTVATMVIHIPTAANGYIHPGDGMVLLSGILLGPLTGAVAGGIGSMTADLITGYVFYAPATFLIKALAAFCGGYLYRELTRNRQKAQFWLVPFLIAGIASSVLITGGYFTYELMIYSRSASRINIPFNLVQNLFSLIVSGSLLPFLLRIHEIRSISLERESDGI